MSNVKTCCKDGCSVTFDIDNGEGCIQTKLVDKQVVKTYYCCLSHREA